MRKHEKLEMIVLQSLVFVCVALDIADILNLFTGVPFPYLLLVTLLLMSATLKTVSSEHLKHAELRQEVAELHRELVEVRRELAEVRQENTKLRDLMSTATFNRACGRLRLRTRMQLDWDWLPDWPPAWLPMVRNKEIKAIKEATKDNGP
jgi:chromosome segregation ATPase